MKQKIVIYVPMHDEKSGSKAMTVASRRKGVTKVEVVRDKNLLVVMGENVDSVKLAESLRKKFCMANIVSVHSTIMPSYMAKEEEEEDSEDEEHVHRPQHFIPIQYPNYYQPPLYNPDPPPTCSIM